MKLAVVRIAECRIVICLLLVLKEIDGVEILKLLFYTRFEILRNSKTRILSQKILLKRFSIKAKEIF